MDTGGAGGVLVVVGVDHHAIEAFRLRPTGSEDHRLTTTLRRGVGEGTDHLRVAGETILTTGADELFSVCSSQYRAVDCTLDAHVAHLHGSCSILLLMGCSGWFIQHRQFIRSTPNCTSVNRHIHRHSAIPAQVISGIFKVVLQNLTRHVLLQPQHVSKAAFATRQGHASCSSSTNKHFLALTVIATCQGNLCKAPTVDKQSMLCTCVLRLCGRALFRFNIHALA